MREGWGKEDINSKMWGYEMDARVSEYTSHEAGAEDHWVQCRDLIFTVVNDSESFQVIGGGAYFKDIGLGKVFTSSVARFRAQAFSQKTGAPVKKKCVGRRSSEEAQYLDDLVSFVAFSEVKLTDELSADIFREDAQMGQLGRRSGVKWSGVLSKIFVWMRAYRLTIPHTTH